MAENQALREHRFSKTNPPKPHTQKHPNGYFLPLLKRFLKKKINYIDPETNETIKGKVKDAVVWRLILNATQGDNEAIKEIFNRLDGKTPQKLIGEGFQQTVNIFFENMISKAIPNRISEHVSQN